MDKADETYDKLVRLLVPKTPGLVSVMYEDHLHENIRKLCEGATMKYGKQYPSGEMSDCWLDDKHEFHTHRTPIFSSLTESIEEPRVSKQEVIEMLRAVDNHHPSLVTYAVKLKSLADRLERHKGELK